MALRILTESTNEPVSVDEIKSYLKIQTTAEDTLLASLITAARKVAENKTGRAMAVTTRELTLDGFPSGGIELPYAAPLSTVSTDIAIRYYDSSGAMQTLSSTGYYIDHRTEPGFITPSYDNDWPDTYDIVNAVTVTYVSGYSTATVPENAKLWIKQRVNTMWLYRSGATPENVSNLRRDYIDGLLDDLRIQI